MKKMSILPLLAVFLALTFVSFVSAEEEEIITAIDTSGAWRLPFDGTKSISCAPGERPNFGAGQCDHIRHTVGTTVVKDEQAIDYYVGGVEFPVLAPANGVVFDTGDEGNSGYGVWLRINHNGTYSFFGHLRASSILVTPGNSVRQGQQIATASNTGNAFGRHLHFDARIGATLNNAYSGNPSPSFALPGNWFNSWYSPVPNLQYDDEDPSGGAQYPEQASRPSTTSPGARHLSNHQSPPNVIAGWASNISPSSVTLHMGGSPDTNATNWATSFHVYKLQGSNWPGIPGGPVVLAPRVTIAVGNGNQSLSNGQHRFRADGHNVQAGASATRYWDIWPGSATLDAPHITATYRLETDNTTLEFCSPGPGRYRVLEYHGVDTTTAYTGKRCSIMVHRIINGDNRYTVRKRTNGVWGDYTPWLIVP